MAITHIVLFKFKALIPEEEVQDVCQRMLALRQNCVHPTTKQAYIKSSVGGKDSSVEGKQDGLTYAFISEFQNEEDRKYYLEKDPAHLDFVKSLEGVVDKAVVVDFTPGQF